MTAQAGAVAAWVDKRDLVNLLDGKADRATVHRERFDGDDRPLFATPPAAVPVEALEGLVAKWAEAASRMLDDAESMRDDDPRAARLLTSMAEQQVRDADELTQLIKDRSNG